MSKDYHQLEFEPYENYDFDSAFYDPIKPLESALPEFHPAKKKPRTVNEAFQQILGERPFETYTQSSTGILKDIELTPFRIKLWLLVFSDLAIASILGAIAHGFKLSEVTYNALWNILYLALGLLVAFFVIAVIFDLWGEDITRKYMPRVLAIGMGFWLIALIWPDSFVVFIAYEMLAMLFALGGYIYLMFKKKLAGATWMAIGILITMIAAVIQATKALSFNLIWDFDHNGVYHLIQMLAIGLLLTGLTKKVSQSID